MRVIVMECHKHTCIQACIDKRMALSAFRPQKSLMSKQTVIIAHLFTDILHKHCFTEQSTYNFYLEFLDEEILLLSFILVLQYITI